MKRWIAGLGAFMMLAGLTMSANAGPYDRLVVFGDSLSDTGNLYNFSGHTFPDPAYYYQGRMSNGKLWVEDLAPKLGFAYNQADNYAFVGAATDSRNDANGPGIPTLPGMQQELAGYLGTHATADPNALYVIWGGPNDYDLGQLDPTVPAGNILNYVEQLQAIGAKHFLIPNLPDLGQLPVSRNTPYSSILTQLTNGHNATLAAGINSLESGNPTLDIHELDVHSLFETLLSDPGKYGYTNTTDPAMLALGQNPDNYVFWDDAHPTAATHRLLADAAYAVVVPEGSSAILLMAISVPGLFLLRRRR